MIYYSEWSEMIINFTKDMLGLGLVEICVELHTRTCARACVIQVCIFFIYNYFRIGTEKKV